jgi:hypothetical protein
MEDYSQGKIYKIISSECDDVYYGSTVETLKRRLQKHKSSYNHFLKGKKRPMTSFQILEKGNYHIVLVEDYPCNSKEELQLRERFYIENNECVNKFIPGRTEKEYKNSNQCKELRKIWFEEHKDELREYHKEYREANKEKIREQQKEKVICEICGFEGLKSLLSRHQKTKKCLEHNNIQLI